MFVMEVSTNNYISEDTEASPNSSVCTIALVNTLFTQPWVKIWFRVSRMKRRKKRGLNEKIRKQRTLESYERNVTVRDATSIAKGKSEPMTDTVQCRVRWMPLRGRKEGTGGMPFGPLPSSCSKPSSSSSSPDLLLSSSAMSSSSSAINLWARWRQKIWSWDMAASFQTYLQSFRFIRIMTTSCTHKGSVSCSSYISWS